MRRLIRVYTVCWGLSVRMLSVNIVYSLNQRYYAKKKKKNQQNHCSSERENGLYVVWGKRSLVRASVTHYKINVYCRLYQQKILIGQALIGLCELLSDLGLRSSILPQGLLYRFAHPLSIRLSFDQQLPYWFRFFGTLYIDLNAFHAR